MSLADSNVETGGAPIRQRNSSPSQCKPLNRAPAPRAAAMPFIWWPC